MPVIKGGVVAAGAVVDVLVGVRTSRRKVLTARDEAVPAPLLVRALIDTGASVSGFAASVFTRLGLAPVGTRQILTPSSGPDAPHVANEYEVALFLIANGSAHRFGDLRALVAGGWRPGEGVEGLIGRDVLDHCGFQYWGPDQRFQLSF